MLPSDSTLPALVERHARDRPDAPFVVFAEDGSAWTYGMAWASADRWAEAVHAAGIGPGDTVLTMLPPSRESVACWVGIARLRAIDVPINTGYVGRLLGYVMTDARARLMIVHVDYLPAVAEVLAELAEPSTVVVVGGPVPSSWSGSARMVTAQDFLADASGTEHRNIDRPSVRDIAHIIYTSGTTGPSKGVLVTWRQTELTARECMPASLFGEQDAFYSPFPMFHVSARGPIDAAALLGARVIMRRRFETGEFWSDIRKYGATTTILVGAMANFIHQQPPRPDDGDSPLRDVVMIPLIDDVAGFSRRFDLGVRTVFNMTEISCCIASDGYKLANTTSCGRIRPGFQARIVDSDDVEVGPGELGELALRADEPWSLMAGYWGKPEATVNAWRNQWLHTGDGFTRDADGNFYFVDRIKDAIRRRGENVSSFEVELEVNSHPDVLESAAVAVPSEHGEDEIKVVLVAQPGATITLEELWDYLSARMARFMVPRYLEIVESLPKTPTEKIRKVELRASGIGPDTWDARERLR